MKNNVFKSLLFSIFSLIFIFTSCADFISSNSSEDKNAESQEYASISITTGSSANECSKVLKEAGAKKVGVFTIAKD